MKGKNEGGPYPIPSIFFAKSSKIIIGFIIFLDLDILLLSITIPELGNYEKIHFETQDLIFFGGLFILLVLSHYLFIIGPLLKNEYIELNENSIKIKVIFKKEKVYDWDKIEHAERVAGYRGWTLFKITGIEPIDKLFIKTTTIKIPLTMKFANISEERLLHTIDKMKAMSVFKTE